MESDPAQSPLLHYSSSSKSADTNIETMSFTLRQKTVIPGFGVTLGFTLLYLSLIVLIPLSTIFLRTSALPAEKFWEIVLAERSIAAYKLTFGASFAAALLNAAFGVVVAWVLSRYKFPGKRIVDALVDLPFALPTAVAGIALTAVYAQNGWIGQHLEPRGIKVAFTELGVMVAMVFVGLPFAVRTVQPVLEDLDKEIEEAASTLGASRWQTIRRVLLPAITPALLTGFTLAFARALGEYGSVVFISGNLPLKTEIVPLLIMAKLDQFDYLGATALAVVMLVISFTLILIINLLQWWSRRRAGAA